MNLNHMDRDRRLLAFQHLERMRISSLQEEGETTIISKEVELLHSKPLRKITEYICLRCH